MISDSGKVEAISQTGKPDSRGEKRFAQSPAEGPPPPSGSSGRDRRSPGRPVRPRGVVSASRRRMKTTFAVVFLAALSQRVCPRDAQGEDGGWVLAAGQRLPVPSPGGSVPREAQRTGLGAKATDLCCLCANPSAQLHTHRVYMRLRHGLHVDTQVSAGSSRQELRVCVGRQAAVLLDAEYTRGPGQGLADGTPAGSLWAPGCPPGARQLAPCSPSSLRL